mmetsp:Transcript_7473/g.18044  ORF Transcript_7473/g.18044 Transcript_7473/m.18044 type:complete len:904 (+) Transcript_7473:124-2835(+)
MAWVLVWALLSISTSLWASAQQQQQQQQQAPGSIAQHDGEQRPSITPVHVVFLADCTRYSDWQSVGMAWSYKTSGQPGSLSKVMCCSEQDRAAYPPDLLQDVETWVAPNYANNPHNHDRYVAYNKPEAVVDWLEHQTPEEEYVVVLDSDMTLRHPFLVEDLHPSPGRAIGARYTYMIGVNNELAERHVKDIPPRNDTLAGPYGRRADQVGGFFFIHRDDLKRLSKPWLQITEEVRFDEEAWRLTGDVYSTHRGDKPWISEMYGYAFGAAKSNVWHKWDTISMIYPSYNPSGIPKVMHYGLLFSIDDYKFDKHWHFDFDVTVCPPWDSPIHQHSRAGIFEPPPWPKDLRSYKRKGRGGGGEYYRDLLSLETITTLNAAFCDFHLRHCPPSQQLLDVCTMAVTQYTEVQWEVQDEELHYRCKDTEPRCRMWAKAGECDKNVAYMNENCREACGLCSHLSETTPRPAPSETFQMLQKLASTLGVEMPVHSPDNPSVFMPGKRIADPNNGATAQQAAGQAGLQDSGSSTTITTTNAPDGSSSSTGQSSSGVTINNQSGGDSANNHVGISPSSQSLGNTDSAQSSDSTSSLSVGSTTGGGGESGGNVRVGSEGPGNGSGINAGGGLVTEQQEGSRLNLEALKAWQQRGVGENVGKNIAENSGGSSSSSSAGAATTDGGTQGMQQQQQQAQQHVQPEDELNITKQEVVSPGERAAGETQQAHKAQGGEGPAENGEARVSNEGGVSDKGRGEPGVGGQQLQTQQAAAPPAKSKSALLLRCYRMSLKLDEVKACVDAARKLEQWEKPPLQASANESGSFEDTLDSQGTQGLTVSGLSQPLIRASRKLVLPTKDEATSKAAGPTNAEGKDSSILPKMITWQVCGVWILAIVVFLAAMPRFFRMRKRRAFRSE